MLTEQRTLEKAREMEARFVVATHCNADCLFCLNEYVGTKSSDFSLMPAHYRTIMDVLAELGVTKSTISGGEPTLRKDLKEIVSSVRPQNRNLTMVSNGYKLVDHLEAVENLDELHVSYHSTNPEKWFRITKVRGGPEKVNKNLGAVISLRNPPSIKLNVVADEQNSSPEEVRKYLELARKFGAQINVFKEGFYSFLREMGADVRADTPAADKWELDSLGGIRISNSCRKVNYVIDGVRVSLSYTSTDEPSWSSCWISPTGAAFVDVRQRSPLINLMPALERRDRSKLEESFISLVREANAAGKINGNEDSSTEASVEYSGIIDERKRYLDVVDNSIRITNLLKWRK